jgi:hypothetical protein
MRPIEEIQRDIDTLKIELHSLDGQTATKAAHLENLKAKNQELMERSYNLTRTPKSITAQLNLIRQVGDALAALRQLRDRVQGRLSALERELRLAKLYAEAKTFVEAEYEYFERAEGVRLALAALKVKMTEFEEITRDFIATPGPSLSTLAAICSSPDLADLSLRDFFNGQAVPNDGSNDAFVAERVRRYIDLAKELPQLETDELLWGDLHAHMSTLGITASQIVPRSQKYRETATESAPVAAERHPEVIQGRRGKLRFNRSTGHYEPLTDPNRIRTHVVEATPRQTAQYR